MNIRLLYRNCLSRNTLTAIAAFVAAVMVLDGVVSAQTSKKRPGKQDGQEIVDPVEQSRIDNAQYPTREREGGTPFDPHQDLKPYAIKLKTVNEPIEPGRSDNQSRSSGDPAAGSGTAFQAIASPAEYSPVRGVMYKYGSGWNDIVTAMVVALTADPDHDDIAYVCVDNTSQRNSAISEFTSAGADLSKVEFLIQPGEGIGCDSLHRHAGSSLPRKLSGRGNSLAASKRCLRWRSNGNHSMVGN